MTIETNTVIDSLAAKLAGLDLTDAETDLLRCLIAEPDEVEGFGDLDWAREIRKATKPIVIADLTFPKPIDKATPNL